MDFALNATAIGQNLNTTYPGGKDDAACIPKMANLNTQVGLHTSLSLKPSHPPSLPWPLTDTHFMPQSSTAWCQWGFTTPAWKSHTVWSPQSSQEGSRAIIKLLMVGKHPVMHCDPWAQHCWHSAIRSEIILFAHHEQVSQSESESLTFLLKLIFFVLLSHQDRYYLRLTLNHS